jgi:hypothetical protein
MSRKRPKPLRGSLFLRDELIHVRGKPAIVPVSESLTVLTRPITQRHPGSSIVTYLSLSALLEMGVRTALDVF